MVYGDKKFQNTELSYTVLDISIIQIKINPFMPTVSTFAVRETDVSRHNGGTSGAPIMR